MAQLKDLLVIGDARINGTLYTNFNGPFTATSGNMKGHLYLTGADAGSSIGNTSQIVFGTPTDNHVVISSNRGAIIINPTTSSTSGQIVLYTDRAADFPNGINGNASSATKVNNSLTVKLNGGTTEGTNLFTFNGSVAKTVNITPSAIGAAPASHTHDYAASSHSHSEYAAKNDSNTFNGEQKMLNATYAPTMNDIASGIGCSLKNSRACDNQLIVAEVWAPITAKTDSTINMTSTAGEIPFYKANGANNGQFSGKTQMAKITSSGIYEGSTLLSDKYAPKSHTHGYIQDGTVGIKASDSNEISFASNANYIYFGYDNRLNSSGVVTNYKFGTHSGVAGASKGIIECGAVIEDGTTLSEKYAPKSHTHSYASSSHTHDDRYYTESEINNLLSGVGGSYTLLINHTTSTAAKQVDINVSQIDWNAYNKVVAVFTAPSSTTNVNGYIFLNQVISDYSTYNAQHHALTTTNSYNKTYGLGTLYTTTTTEFLVDKNSDKRITALTTATGIPSSVSSGLSATLSLCLGTGVDLKYSQFTYLTYYMYNNIPAGSTIKIYGVK